MWASASEYPTSGWVIFQSATLGQFYIGAEEHHVNWRGWCGLTDRELLDLVVREEFVFVTNNARDFRKLMAEAELHAGLIVVVPNVRPIAQAELLARALYKIARIPDMINKVVEIDLDELRIYELPKLG
jgi:hypothetical protein